MSEQRRKGTVEGLGAAALFGLSAPLAKRLLDSADPELLAGLLYAGAAIALSLVMTVRPRASEARLQGSDVPFLAVVTVTGGVLAPVAMLAGLDRTSAVAGSLLLNLEAPLTILFALLLFGEHLGRTSKAAAAFVIVGGALLGLGPGAVRADTVGALLITAACGLWAIDNNLTQRLTARDPFAIVRAKAAVAAAANLAIATVRGNLWPNGSTILASLALGAAAYGASVVLDAYALRHVGAAREAALFATGPFFGAVAAVPLLGEELVGSDIVAAAAMACGIALLLRARHAHLHIHERLSHDHRHRHDDPHHTHLHDPPVDGWHSHVHSHEPMAHAHPHDSDLHHRHPHTQ